MLPSLIVRGFILDTFEDRFLRVGSGVGANVHVFATGLGHVSPFTGVMS